MSKFSWKGYFKPTPKRIRVIGDSLVAAATFAASVSVLNGHAVAGTVIMVIGASGKFISNFFTDEVISVVDAVDVVQPDQERPQE